MRVIIGIDGSEFGLAAINAFCNTIGKAGDEVRLISVVEPLDHIVGAPFGIVDDFYNEYINEARKKAALHLEEAKKLIMACALKLDVSADVLTGPPARTMVESAEDWNADLIIVGSHGRGFWKRIYLGSVSSSIVHNAPCSVFIARKQ